MKINISELCNKIESITNVSTNETLKTSFTPGYILSAYYENFEKVLFKNGSIGLISGIYYQGSNIQVEII